MEPEIETQCNNLRKLIKDVELSARSWMDHVDQKLPETIMNQRGEQKAQIMLAVRHLKDARMRLGKVIQYNGDGVSCYDK